MSALEILYFVSFYHLNISKSPQHKKGQQGMVRQIKLDENFFSMLHSYSDDKSYREDEMLKLKAVTVQHKKIHTACVQYFVKHTSEEENVQI